MLTNLSKCLRGLGLLVPRPHTHVRAPLPTSHRGIGACLQVAGDQVLLQKHQEALLLLADQEQFQFSLE